MIDALSVAALDEPAAEVDPVDEVLLVRVTGLGVFTEPMRMGAPK